MEFSEYSSKIFDRVFTDLADHSFLQYLGNGQSRADLIETMCRQVRFQKSGGIHQRPILAAGVYSSPC